MTEYVIELAPFKLKEGVEEVALLRASDNLQDSLRGFAGFLRRTLAKEAEDKYVDIVWWGSQAAAEAAMAKVMESAACQAYFALMELDPAAPNGGVTHLRVLAEY